jgi:hypothetical protein
MKESIKPTAAHFSSRRMVKEYYRKFYAHVLERGHDNCGC